MKYMYLKSPVNFHSKLWALFKFLAHLSWKLKWTILIAGCPSFVRPPVNFYIFDFSRTTGPISTRLGTYHPWGEGLPVSSNEGGRPSSRGDGSERVKMHWIFFLKILFSRTSWPNSIKLGTNWSWVKETQVYSNKEPRSLQRGNNYKNVKWGRVI
jgi:hypothetical protein